MTGVFLPTLNAGLNAASAVFLTAGFIFIRRKNNQAHQICMLAALSTSILFLISYLTYHAQHGVTRYPGVGTIRIVYFSLLLVHTILAVAIVPLVLVTLHRAWRERFDAHRRWARWTWPLWMTVSVTGVMVYWMLYK